MEIIKFTCRSCQGRKFFWVGKRCWGPPAKKMYCDECKGKGYITYEWASTEEHIDYYQKEALKDKYMTIYDTNKIPPRQYYGKNTYFDYETMSWEGDLYNLIDRNTMPVE